MFSSSLAQEKVLVKGQVLDSSGNGIAGAIITAVQKATDKREAFSFSDKDGIFTLDLYTDSIIVLEIKVNAMGFKSDSVSIYLQSGLGPKDLRFVLTPNSQTLKEVVIKAQPLSFSIRNDTIEFSAKAYLNPQTKKVQDLLANIPGFKIDADGKINFNGKEVEKILIEGEDLSEKNYQLISKNLGAGYINKVQVLNNYNDDRLMKAVEQTDNIGINLTINEKSKNKLSGSVELGAGSLSRLSLDNSLILLKKRIKLLSFIKYNNISDLPNADLQYYYNREANEASNSLENFGSSNLVKTGLIVPPDLPGKYIRNNNDFSTAGIASCRLGNAAKLRMAMAYGVSNLKNQNENYQKYILPDFSSWELFERQLSDGKLKEFVSALAVTHDRGKRNTGTMAIDFILPENTNNYQSKINGAFTDSLLENLRTKKNLFKLEGFESFLLPGNRVVKIRYRINNDDSRQYFESETERFSDYFNTDSSVVSFFEHLDRKSLNAEINTGLYGKKKKIEYFFQVKSTYQKNDFSGDLFVNTDSTRFAKRTADLSSIFSYFDQSFVASGNYLVSKKLSIAGGLRIGIQNSKFTRSGNETQSPDPVIRNYVSINYKLTPFSAVSADYSFMVGKSSSDYFFPDSLISGNVIVLNPASVIKQPSKQVFGLKYFSHNFKKSTDVLIQANLSFSDRDYNFAQILQPKYSNLSYQPVDGNRFANIIAGFEKLFYSIRLKTGLQVSAMSIKSHLLINDVKSENQNSNIRVQGKISSAFSGPLNLELKPSVIFSETQTREWNGQWIKYSFWQAQGSGKIILRPGDRWYFAAVYLYSGFGKKSFFNSADLFAEFDMNSVWNFSLTVHNLFNAGNLISSDFSPTSYGDQKFALVGRYILFKVNWNF